MVPIQTNRASLVDFVYVWECDAMDHEGSKIGLNPIVRIIDLNCRDIL